MKSEEFFKLTLVKQFGLKESDVEKYFKGFKKNFRNIQGVQESLGSSHKSVHGETVE